MMRLIIAAALGSLATAATAQTTTCGEEFCKWVCHTTAAPTYAPPPTQLAPVPNYTAMFANGYNEGRDQGAALAEMRAREHDQAVRSSIAAEIKAGRCNDAVAEAIELGTPSVIESVSYLCRPAR